MHDIGKVVLAANFDEQYRGAQSLAKRQKLPAWEVEHEIFGASHGEIGAYLLGLWGMPLDLLEVAAMHHQPSRSISKEFTTLTAVHIANVLEHELTPDPDEPELAAKFDDDYLARVGLTDVIPQWREMVFKRDFTKPAAGKRTEKAPAPKAVRTGESDTARLRRVSPLPATADKSNGAGAKSSTANAPWFEQNKRWVYAAVAAGVVIPVAIWLMVGSSSTTTPDTATAPLPAPTAPATATTTQSSKPAATTTATTAANPAAANSGSTPAMVVRARTASTTAAPTTVASKAPVTPVAFADLKLQGIFYASKDASAIVSGVMVHENERVFGTEVVQITPATVVLEYKGQRRTLVLK